jgi:hypothetical protein
LKFPWSEELARLNEAIRPIANRPVDLNDLDNLFNTPRPMDEAGMRMEAQALLLKVLKAFEIATDEERREIRILVNEYNSFFWAAYPPASETAAESLRLRLMHFALIDQYPDPRDAVLHLQELCEHPGVSVDTLASLRREVAAMASDEDRYGFGSTQSMLLREYPSGYGKRCAPE